MSNPASFADYFGAELDKKLATLPDNRARIVCCAKQYGIWSVHFDIWQRTGRQPYGAPHPTLGAMDAFDFRLLLSAIDAKRHEIEKRETVDA